MCYVCVRASTLEPIATGLHRVLVSMDRSASTAEWGLSSASSVHCWLKLSYMYIAGCHGQMASQKTTLFPFQGLFDQVTTAIQQLYKSHGFQCRMFIFDYLLTATFKRRRQPINNAWHDVHNSCTLVSTHFDWSKYCDSIQFVLFS